MRSISARTPRLWLVARRAHEDVVRDRQPRPHRLEAPGDLVDELLRRHAALGGGLRDLLAVLVDAREKPHVVAAHAAISRDDVGADLLVRVTDVRIAIRVVDGGREIEPSHSGLSVLVAAARTIRRAVRGHPDDCVVHRDDRVGGAGVAPCRRALGRLRRRSSALVDVSSASLPSVARRRRRRRPRRLAPRHRSPRARRPRLRLPRPRRRVRRGRRRPAAARQPRPPRRAARRAR